MKSNAETVEAYLAGLPDDRRGVIEAMLGLVRANLPAGYEEAMNWGSVCWQVPLQVYPDTYNKQPLLYVGLAAQKRHIGLYLCGLHAMRGLEESFKTAFAAAGKRLDMGAACVRFQHIDQLHLPAIAAAISAVPMDAFIADAKARQAARKKL